jgi:hypothetical protein
MDRFQTRVRKPQFRDGVCAIVHETQVEMSLRDRSFSFEFSEHERSAVAGLIADLKAGGFTIADLASRSSEIEEQLPDLIEDFDRLRLLTESDRPQISSGKSGAQLFREVRRMADRLTARVAKSAFYHELLEARATRSQLIGYALEYYWIVQSAPGLIGPALAAPSGVEERTILQDFLKSELGHDAFLRAALLAVGLTSFELDTHQPLPATFSLCASLGVYARQHPLSFKACLFLFEQAQPRFVDAFDVRCGALGLPEQFYLPLRAHADINADYGHEDISRELMGLEGALDLETCSVVKKHVALMIETMIRQEEQILAFYAQPRRQVPRTFE